MGRTDQVFDPEERVALGITISRDTPYQRDRNALGRSAVVGGVDARAADELVRTGPAGDHVIAVVAIDLVVPGTARQPVGAVVANENVGVRGADQVLKPEIVSP